MLGCVIGWSRDGRRSPSSCRCSGILASCRTGSWSTRSWSTKGRIPPLFWPEVFLAASLLRISFSRQPSSPWRLTPSFHDLLSICSLLCLITVYHLYSPLCPILLLLACHCSRPPVYKKLNVQEEAESIGGNLFKFESIQGFEGLRFKGS